MSKPLPSISTYLSQHAQGILPQANCFVLILIYRCTVNSSWNAWRHLLHHWILTSKHATGASAQQAGFYKHCLPNCVYPASLPNKLQTNERKGNTWLALVLDTKKNYTQTDVGMLFCSWVSLYWSKLQYHHNTIITQNYNNCIRIHMIIIAAWFKVGWNLIGCQCFYCVMYYSWKSAYWISSLKLIVKAITSMWYNTFAQPNCFS